MGNRSNIARQYDTDFLKHQEAQNVALAIVAELQKLKSDGALRPHQVAPCDEFLARFHSDPKLYLTNVNGGGGAITVTYGGGKHGMDGSSLPQKETLAEALTTRSRLGEDLTGNWEKLSSVEQSSRTRI